MYKRQEGARSRAPEGRYDPAEAPKRAVLTSGHKTVPDFAAIHHRLGLSPEARALVEEFEPGTHQFLPVEVARPRRSKRPIHRTDGRVLDGPFHLFIPQVYLDAVWIERSAVQVTPTHHGPELVVPHLGSDRIVLRRELVAGRHVWRGLFHLPGRVFFSDALVREAKRRKLRGPEFTHLEEA